MLSEKVQSNGKVDVTVLTPVLNEEAHIRETVAAMRAQQFDGGVEFLFMDGGSNDFTRDILEALASEDARIRVLDNPGRQVTHALNVGLQHARGEYVARMDAHTHYPPEYLARGVDRLRAGDVDWVGCPPIPAGDGTWSRRVSLALASPLGLGGSKKWSVDRETELDTGVFCGVWRRETLEQHGGWDEGWHVNEDSELAARFLERGQRIVGLPEMAARYVPRDSISGLARQYWRYGFYRAKTSRRHPSSMRGQHVLPPGLVVTAIVAAVGPGRVAGPARAALGVYAVTLASESVRVARTRPADAAALPLVFATMHASWGGGFLAGAARFGAPLRAICRLLRPSWQANPDTSRKDPTTRSRP
jgi:glycosyltransferase involved in cell wall biosynthesis